VPSQSDRTAIPLGFGEVIAEAGDHIAHFYRGESEMLTVLGPYIAEGIRRRDRCLVLCDPETADKLRAWFSIQGLEVASAERSRQLVFHPGEPTRRAMRAFFERLETESRGEGYELVRVGGDGGWALAGRTSASEMLEWEALYDEAWGDSTYFLALCQFDLTRFGGDAIMDALRSHPLTVIGQTIHGNPFHIRAETLLADREGEPAQPTGLGRSQHPVP
jgi:hypothetical protein